MFSDLLFVLIAVSAIVFTFSTGPKPEKIQSGIAEVVDSNHPTQSISFNLVKYGIKLCWISIIVGHKP
jgi:hypothetical protein